MGVYSYTSCRVELLTFAFQKMPATEEQHRGERVSRLDDYHHHVIQPYVQCVYVCVYIFPKKPTCSVKWILHKNAFFSQRVLCLLHFLLISISCLSSQFQIFISQKIFFNSQTKHSLNSLTSWNLKFVLITTFFCEVSFIASHSS